MRESFLKLNDRTVVLAGPLNQITSTIVTVMSERGCDVGVVANERTNEIRRFCENITDAREVHHNYGRAACIPSDLKDEKDCTDAISRVAETFGSIDIVIDTHLLDLCENNEELEERFRKTETLCKAGMPFMKGRSKGRILFVTNEILRQSEGKFESLRSIMSDFATTVMSENISMNMVSTGVTEELLINLYGGKKSIKDAFEDFEDKHGKCRIVEPTEIASVISFLASPISSGICGQIVKVTAGAEL